MCCFWGTCNNSCGNGYDHCEEERRRAYWEGYRDGYNSCRWYGYNDNEVCDDYYNNDDCGCR
ncbi:hypothetical protein [Clostridium sp. E02]|uniref:hypothetical protein n=1 Tax=Clostridium sp. E02 TaxID=2487134 RepID=UPI000F522C9B|nr:hypothetical protein [Clostridium sp. E02]